MLYIDYLLRDYIIVGTTEIALNPTTLVNVLKQAVGPGVLQTLSICAVNIDHKLTKNEAFTISTYALLACSSYSL